MSEFKSKEDKLFIENYIRLQRRLGKGVIANVNPENEIYGYCPTLMKKE